MATLGSCFPNIPSWWAQRHGHSGCGAEFASTPFLALFLEYCFGVVLRRLSDIERRWGLGGGGHSNFSSNLRILGREMATFWNLRTHIS